jgi:hypothetical protein
MKLLAEMPKIAKCLKCLKPFGQEALDRLRYSVNFNKLKRKVGYYFPDFWFRIRQASIVHNKDGAQRLHNFRHFSPPPAD